MEFLDLPLRDSKSAAIPRGPNAPVTSSNSHDSEASFSEFSEDECSEERDLWSPRELEESLSFRLFSLNNSFALLATPPSPSDL